MKICLFFLFFIVLNTLNGSSNSLEIEYPQQAIDKYEETGIDFVVCAFHTIAGETNYEQIIMNLKSQDNMVTELLQLDQFKKPMYNKDKGTPSDKDKKEIDNEDNGSDKLVLLKLKRRLAEESVDNKEIPESSEITQDSKETVVENTEIQADQNLVNKTIEETNLTKDKEIKDNAVIEPVQADLKVENKIVQKANNLDDNTVNKLLNDNEEKKSYGKTFISECSIHNTDGTVEKRVNGGYCNEKHFYFNVKKMFFNNFDNDNDFKNSEQKVHFNFDENQTIEFDLFKIIKYSKVTTAFDSKSCTLYIRSTAGFIKGAFILLLALIIS